MIVAYLVAQYPKTSHSFIRREIAALERLGLEVRRYAVRRIDELLVDPADVAESRITRVLLDAGAWTTLAHVAVLGFSRPGRWLAAVRQALRMGSRSERGRLYHLAYFGEACTLVRWMKREGVGHLHAHFGTNATAVALLARRLGGPPYSFTVHGPHDLTMSPLLSFEDKVREAGFVATISHHTRAQLMRFCDPRDWEKLHIVRCGLDSIYLQQPPVALPKEPRLVCVARFDPEKGHLVLLDAAAKLAQEGLAFEIDLIGDGMLRPQIERAIAERGLRGRVVLSGWLSSEQVRDRLLASRIFVLPSFAEGLPVVLMEALAIGRPVITTYVAGIPELVVDGENGWLVPASSVEDLARAMRAALTAPEAELARMGARGRERVLRQHDVDVEARKLALLVAAQR